MNPRHNKTVRGDWSRERAIPLERSSRRGDIKVEIIPGANWLGASSVSEDRGLQFVMPRRGHRGQLFYGVKCIVGYVPRRWFRDMFVFSRGLRDAYGFIVKSSFHDSCG